MSRYLSWLANACLGVLCCFLAANAVNTVMSALLAPAPDASVAAAGGAAAPQRAWSDRASGPAVSRLRASVAPTDALNRGAITTKVGSTCDSHPVP